MKDNLHYEKKAFELDEAIQKFMNDEDISLQNKKTQAISLVIRLIQCAAGKNVLEGVGMFEGAKALFMERCEDIKQLKAEIKEEKLKGN